MLLKSVNHQSNLLFYRIENLRFKYYLKYQIIFQIIHFIVE